MVKVLYANKHTGTVIHDIYLSCKEAEVKEYILSFGTNGIEFPEKLVKELPPHELDMLLFNLHTSYKKKKEYLDCFHITCNKVWEEVKLEDIDFRKLLLEELNINTKDLHEKRATNN